MVDARPDAPRAAGRWRCFDGSFGKPPLGSLYQALSIAPVALDRHTQHAVLTARDVAHICSVTERCVRNWARRGISPGAARLGGVWRFDAVQFWAWRAVQQERDHLPKSMVPRTPGAIAGPDGVRSALRPAGIKSDGRLERLLGLRR
jgi:hypothetical protein